MKPALMVDDIKEPFFGDDPITTHSLEEAIEYVNAAIALFRERKLGVDTAIITGSCAEYCGLSTYRGAKDLDLTPILLRGSLASANPENIRFVESVSDIISYGP
jgi:hypothetical protein